VSFGGKGTQSTTGCKYVHDFPACRSIPVGVDRVSHAPVYGLVLEKFPHGRDKPLIARTREFRCPRLHPLPAFGDLPHDEDRFAEGRGFLLDAPGVGKHEEAFFHEVEEVRVVQGFQEEDMRDVL